jgi:pteridine reductase
MSNGEDQPVAVVTGAGAPRIGNCIVHCLSQRGYQVAVHANRSMAAAEETAAELSASGPPAIAVQADLTSEQAVKAMVRTVVDRFGHIEALVNCAAIWEPCVLEDVTAEHVRQHLDVNTVGSFLCCQHVGLQMVAQDHGGAIVNIGDWAVVRPYGDYAAYFPSKGAIPAMTRCFAVELARRNPHIRVNAVLPGPAMLPDDLPDVQRRAAIAGTLVKREGNPQNVADAVAFLLENDFVTGVCLPVDGGRSIYSE